MNIKEYSKLIKDKRKELDDLIKRKMPVIAGRMAKDHFQVAKGEKAFPRAN